MPYADPEKRKEYNREYQRQWAREHRTERLQYERSWQERNREKVREISRASKRRNSDHVWARNTLRRAILRGDVEKLPCEVCGDPDSHGHHRDYSKPLEVTWLCKPHHMKEHRKS